MSKKGVTKYNIKKNGINICKIIFKKAKDIEGRFDIKISFYNEKYKIKVHELFSYRSKELFIKNIENKQISYHYGRVNGVKIQLRNIKENESPEEIIYNLVPPNDYSIFPIPLFKIEINNNNEEPLHLIKSNKQKHDGIEIELDNNNTIEVFMANPNDKNFDNNKLDIAHNLEILAPIEYFASNGGHIGYEKHKYFYDNTGMHLTKKELIGNDFNLIFDGYHNSNFDNKKIESTITFIENELYEDIILNTSFNPIVTIGNKEERLQGYINGNINSCSTNKILVKDTIGERIWKTLKGKEKEEFFNKAINSNRYLVNRIVEFNDRKSVEKEKLKTRVNMFLYVIIKLNQYYSAKYSNGELNKNIPSEILWMINYPQLKAEEINIMLGKYLEIDNFRIIKVRIYPDKQEEVIKTNYSNCVYKINDIKKVAFNYCYLEYDSVFNIHILSNCINNILNKEEISLICRSEDIINETVKWNNLFSKLKTKKYNCSSLEYRTINLNEEFKRNIKLTKIYDVIISYIDNINLI